MGRKKALMVMPHLVDCGGDLMKEWFVEYSMRSPYTGEMKRFREYRGLNALKTADERYSFAQTVIDEIKQNILNGWSPFEKPRETYQDNLLFDTVAKRWGTEKEGVVNIRMYLSEFLGVKKGSVSPRSYQTYQSKLRIFCEWAEVRGLQDVHVGFINTEHIREFLQNIAEDKQLSRLTMDKYTQILHSFFEFLINIKKVMKENPASDLPRLGKVVDQAAKPIPDRERALLLAAMRKYDRQLWIVCQLEYYCAIRPGEMLRLKVDDVDFENGVIRVPCTVSKNRLSESVTMPQQLIKLFKDEGYAQAAPGLYLFSATGMPGVKPLGKNSFRNRFNTLRNKLGLSGDYKLYSFKHTGGVKLVNAGIDTWELQRHFRHKSVETTERYIRKNFAVKSDMLKNHFPDID